MAGNPASEVRSRVKSNPGATARRKIVLGSAEGTVAGPEAAAVTVARAKRQTPQRPARKPAELPKPRKVTGGPGKLSGTASGGLILIEFLAGTLIIVSGLFTKGAAKGYVVTMSEITVRLSALTAVFFILFLVAGSRSGGKAAAWFGLLIDVGIGLHAASEAEFSSLAGIISGQGTGVDQATLTAATTVPEPKPPVQLPDE